jgi:hypothetical protein
MNRWILTLAGLLATQLVLAVAIYVSDQDYDAFKAKDKLLSFEQEKVNRLLIEDGKASVTLSKTTGQWTLPDEEDFPADQNNINLLLEKLARLEKGWPVATTSSALRRFKVAEDEYERKLTLYNGDDRVAQLYVGTSPGFRKVHMRPDGEEAVFVAELNTYEVETKADAWLNKEHLLLDEADLQQVVLAQDLTLHKEKETWRVKGVKEPERTQEKEVRALIGKLTKLRIESLINKEQSAQYQQKEADFDIEVLLKDGKQLSYHFFKTDKKTNYAFKRSDQDRYFTVVSETVDMLKDATREKLILNKETTQEAPQETDVDQDKKTEP